MQPVLHISHRYILAQRRARTPARDIPHHFPVLLASGRRSHDLSALPGRRSVHHETDAPSADAAAAILHGLQLPQDGFGAVEAACFGTGAAPVFAYDPAEAGFDGGGAVVEVVPIQAHACFQAEGVAGSETGEPERVRAGFLEEKAGEWVGEVWGNGDFKTIFACVAAAGDEDTVFGGGGCCR